MRCTRRKADRTTTAGGEELRTVLEFLRKDGVLMVTGRSLGAKHP
jgi:hypothetical protein